MILGMQGWWVRQGTHRYNQRFAALGHKGQSRSAGGAKYFGETSPWNIVAFELIDTAQPLNVFRLGKRVGSVCRPCHLLALLTVAEVKLSELVLDLEGHGAA
jgi:predicted P-loop ATPase/GTPase